MNSTGTRSRKRRLRDALALGKNAFSRRLPFRRFLSSMPIGCGESHIMQLSENDVRIVKEVLRRFMENKASTPKRFLVVNYQDPEAPERLSRVNVLESLNNVAYLPKAGAFHLCADDEVLQKAKRSLQTVAQALRNLFMENSDKTRFDITEVEQYALTLDENATTETIKLGLYLLRDFWELGCSVGVNPEAAQLGFSSQTPAEYSTVHVGDYIVTPRSFETLWDEHMLRCFPPANAKTDTSAANEPNILLAALLRFLPNEERLESLLVRAHSQNPTKPKVSAAFELHVAWLLGLFGFSTIVLGEYEHIVAPGTKVRQASVDVLAASQAQKTLLLVGCTLNEPGQKDFSTLRYAREIVAREAFAGKSITVVPVVFTAAIDDRSYDRIADRLDAIPIVDADDIKALLQLLPNGRESELLGVLQNLAPQLLGGADGE